MVADNTHDNESFPDLFANSQQPESPPNTAGDDNVEKPDGADKSKETQAIDWGDVTAHLPHPSDAVEASQVVLVA